MNSNVTSPGLSNPALLKVSVLSSGDVLLDGQRVSLGHLEEALKAAKDRKATVWYYREAAQTDPPRQAGEVLKLIVHNRLPVSLSTKSDFSDYVDLKGNSHPREAGKLAPAADPAHAPASDDRARMPEVSCSDRIEEIFAAARKQAAATRELALITPERTRLLLPTPPKGSVQPAIVKVVESIVPSTAQRNIAVIAYTGFVARGRVRLADAGRAIPFFGLLIGLSYIGHAVWIFEGHASALEAGCRDADVLIVDGGMLPYLSKDWQTIAPHAMRNPNILVRDRSSQKFLVIRSAGENKGRIEFAG